MNRYYYKSTFIAHNMLFSTNLMSFFIDFSYLKLKMLLLKELKHHDNARLIMM